MNRKLRVFLTLLLIFAFTLTFVGCSTKEKVDNSSIQEQKQKKYPEKPITLIVPYDAGGGTDLVARTVAGLAEKHLGQPILVVNKVGATGAVGLAEAHKAKPDGYTFLFHTSTMFALKPYGLSDIAGTDMEPVMEIVHDPLLLVTPAAQKYKTLEDVIQAAKKNPGKINLGSGGVGGVNYNGIMLFEKQAGIKFNVVPITSGGAEQMARLVGNKLELGTMYYPEIAEQVKAGQIRVIAAMSDERLPQFPDVPTFKELGYDVSIASSRMVFAPKGTPEACIKAMEEALVKATEDPKFKQYVEQSGTQFKIVKGEAFKERVQKLAKQYAELAQLSKTRQ
ncbi:tripartite tricarboxylate transporter substrate binding protein [Thermanaerosceptrum fracticalcis]|nr:tripartite tricarboxylate transporter substrate binding protein [Thermanaerosceptrum fracticalcis]